MIAAVQVFIHGPLPEIHTMFHIYNFPDIFLPLLDQNNQTLLRT